MSDTIKCIALADTVKGSGLPLMTQGKPVTVTQAQYDAYSDYLQLVKVVKAKAPAKAKPKAKAKAKK